MKNNQKKPLLTKAEIATIQWLNSPKKKDAIKVGRFQEYWVLSKNELDSPILVYDQMEWDAFIKVESKNMNLII